MCAALDAEPEFLDRTDDRAHDEPGAGRGAGPAVTGNRGIEVEWQGRTWLSFGGCNYLGLAQHPSVVAAAHAALDRYGLSTAASRHTTGNTAEHEALEDELADFLSAPALALLPDGCTANMAAAQALAPRVDYALVDEHAHPTISDALRMAGIPQERFPHTDAEACAARLRARCTKGPVRALIATDSVFAATGHVAPLRALVAALGPDDWVLADDCHGVGVLGPSGRGMATELGLAHARLVTTSSLGKGMGCGGGFVAGDAALVRDVVATSTFVCTTPMSPMAAAAGRAAVRLLRNEPQHVAHLGENARRLHEVVDAIGSPTLRVCKDVQTLSIARRVPIRAVGLPAATTQRVHDALRRHGILVPRSRYPGGPETVYFRFATSSLHNEHDFVRLMSAILA